MAADGTSGLHDQLPAVSQYGRRAGLRTADELRGGGVHHAGHGAAEGHGNAHTGRGSAERLERGNGTQGHQLALRLLAAGADERTVCLRANGAAALSGFAGRDGRLVRVRRRRRSADCAFNVRVGEMPVESKRRRRGDLRRLRTADVRSGRKADARTDRPPGALLGTAVDVRHVHVSQRLRGELSAGGRRQDEGTPATGLFAGVRGERRAERAAGGMVCARDAEVLHGRLDAEQGLENAAEGRRDAGDGVGERGEGNAMGKDDGELIPHPAPLIPSPHRPLRGAGGGEDGLVVD